MSYGEFYDIGCEVCNSGKYEEAIEWFDKTLKIKANHVDALNNKGVALVELRRYRDAIDCYDKVLKINPNHTNALNNKGVTLNYLGRYQEAMECCEKALRIKSDCYATLGTKGEILNNLGRYQEALECFDHSLRINPDYKEILEFRDQALMGIGRNKFVPTDVPTSNGKPEVFISYSWKQKSQAKNLFKRLTENGLTCWMDDNQLQAGADLDKELADAIYNSKLVIFCISSDYLKSDNCLREFNYTFKLKKQFIPVLFCKNKKEEFGEWPCHHQVFFKLAEAIYVSNIFEHLDNSTSTKNTPLVDFIKQVKNKLN